ncbi:MAG TPA: DUF92 domain-containing protein [Terriglobales bacterium]|nr:DUF92 domain-containing protein [Terriglobales bacterium]
MTLPATFRLKGTDWVAVALLLALLAFFLVRGSRPLSAAEVLVTAAFAGAGWALRGVNASGAVAGGIIAFILYSNGGWQMFLALFCVFVLTLLATLAGKTRKQDLGLSEPSGGRSATQVGANLLVPTIALVLLPKGLATVVAIAALAEAAADTVSSEIGEAFGQRTYLITTLRLTPPGTNGGVSIDGTLAGIAAAGCVAATGFLVLKIDDVILAAVAAVVGMLFDSVLGATLENKGYLSNDAVNILGTACAAGMALLVCSL